MKRSIRFVILPFLAVLVIACQPPAPQALTEQDIATIEASVEAWQSAFSAKDWAGVAATYTEDAILMPPNKAMVEGRANIEAEFAGTPPFSAASLQITEIDGRGDLAVVRGTYSMTITPEGVPPFEETGKWIEIRLKGADSSWLIHRDIYNSDTPLPM